jgi:elongation factor Ts
MGNVTKEGVIASHAIEDYAVLARFSCETDFVARTEEFLTFSEAVLDEFTIEKRLDSTLTPSLEEKRKLLISKLKENITVSKVVTFQGSKNST